MSRLLRLLLIEDSEDDTRLVRETLESGGFLPSLVRVETGPELRSALSERGFDTNVWPTEAERSFQRRPRILGSTHLQVGSPQQQIGVRAPSGWILAHRPPKICYGFAVTPQGDQAPCAPDQDSAEGSVGC